MYRLHPSSRIATYISAIMQERFTDPHHRWSEVLTDVHNMGRVLEKMCMGPNIIHDQNEAGMEGQGRRPNERFAWQCLGAKKRPMMKYWESPKYKTFCEQNKKGGQGVGRHTDSSISFIEHQLKRDLKESLSKSRHLEELYKHQTRYKKGSMWILFQRSFR
ncbi:hypothetical protein M9H77_02311 [Catharanthus roseus]|uniref:Uncharacterized protein n=1 Tax=Catharanthus roseus TaxID=4058 RepID=A0ACC0C858_CATRO|nr:hypothetical protein M9H77_02311 [Catharanthus roseus]